MKIYNYTVIFDPVKEGGYDVSVPAIPEICTFGETLKEAKAMAADAIRCYIESAIKANEPIPEDHAPSTNFEKFEAELLQDPEIKKEYEDLKPKYEMIQSLIKRRNQLCMSQSQLARIIGTKQPAISRLERGEYDNITLSTLMKVAGALDLDLDISLKTRRTKAPANIS